MSEQTPKQRLVVHFPAFMQAEGIVMRPDDIGATPVERGSYVDAGVGDRVRVGDCVVKVSGVSTGGDIHIDLYAESQARVPGSGD